jgi:hypothetical protein
MMKFDSNPKTTYPQERRYRRFNLKYPVHVKFHSGNSISELDATSRNVSVGGMLLETDAAIPQHSPVTFLMIVQKERTSRPIELAGEGEVVRVENRDAGFAIAVQCKQPISQIEPYLKAVAI